MVFLYRDKSDINIYKMTTTNKKEIEIETRWEDTDYPYRSFVVLFLGNIVLSFIKTST